MTCARAGTAAGDSSATPSCCSGSTPIGPTRTLAELFGGDFAAALPDLAVGEWQGPLRSAHGTHLVRVLGRTEPRVPDLDDVRDRVVQDLVETRRRAQNQAAFEVLRERYEVRMPVSSEVDSARR